VPALLGAVYNPELDTVPPVAVHVTAVFELPVTVAVNVFVVLAFSEAVVGLRFTDTAAAEVTVTVAEAFFVLLAALVAVTV
jgi:hypothetical protein